MAVFEGARLRTIALPGRPRIAEGPALGRRRTRAAVRAGRRTNRLGFVLTGIAVVFLLAFFWLAQDVRVSATGYDIGRLEVARQRMDARVQDLDSDLNRLGREPAIRKQAIDNGLGQLGEPIVLLAR
jgi:hypothetical protein